MPTVLVIATMDTKSEEAYYVRDQVHARGHRTIVMDTGMLLPFEGDVDVTADEVVREAVGMSAQQLCETRNKGECIDAIISGVQILTKRMFNEGRFDAVIGIGGAQGTAIGTAAMRTLPFGVPKFMVTTIASGTGTFGPYVGTSDIIMMHSVCDILGLNFVTRSVFDNAAAGVCGMVEGRSRKQKIQQKKTRGAIAVSMLGTTTPGAMRAKVLIEEEGYEFVAFHQNGTGGIAMEEMIAEGRFAGVLDLNLHEIGDRYFGGLHGSIREGRLEEASKHNIPQVIAPGSINYTVQGPLDSLDNTLKQRKYLVHNPMMTLVRFTAQELREVGKIAARKINKAHRYTSVMIPLNGFSSPDTEGREHWDPEGNEAFITALKENLRPGVEYEEFNLHINDKEFVDMAVNRLFALINEKEKAE